MATVRAPAALEGAAGAAAGSGPVGEGTAGRAQIADGACDQPLVWGALAQMTRRPAETAAALAGAGTRIIAVNRRYPEAVEAMTQFAPAAGIAVRQVADVYPFLDGTPLHELTGQLWVSVAGAVRRPLAVRAEPGTPVADVLDRAGPLDEHPAILLGRGPATASLASRWDAVGPAAHSVLVLPQEHPLVRRLRRSWDEERRIAMSLCSSCRQCTDGCPQYLAGKPVEPHLLMRSLLHGAAGGPGGGAEAQAGLAGCTGCNLCSYVFCPVDLSPSRWAAQTAVDPRGAGAELPAGPERAPREPHPFRRGRQVSVRRLALRLGLGPYLKQKPTYVEG